MPLYLLRCLAAKGDSDLYSRYLDAYNQLAIRRDEPMQADVFLLRDAEIEHSLKAEALTYRYFKSDRANGRTRSPYSSACNVSDSRSP